MQRKDFLQAVALISLPFFLLGFWTTPKESSPSPANEVKTPVIIVPGTGGSQLEAKLNKPSFLHWYCSKTTSVFVTLWFKKSSLLPYAIDCWADNMRLVYDEGTKTMKNAPGVETRVPGFGDTSSIEYLDTDNLVKYFVPMVDRLVSWGYERGVSVRGAPYDFRYGPESAPEYFTKLKKLIEDTYSANGNKKITLMGHSFGCPYTLVFLNKQTKDWKDKYILQWITLSGVWGGFAATVKLYSSGITPGILKFPVSPLKFRDEQRTYSSNVYLLPSRELWSADEVLVKTPERVYTVNDYADFFKDIGFPLGITLRKMVENLTYPLTEHSPNVTVHCLYGTGVNTAARFVFGEKKFPDARPHVVYGDGDGTVNRRSLEACSKWSQRQPYNVTLKQYPSLKHNDVLSDENVFSYIKTLLF
ncbi:hypothetical protein ACROYT_G042327 [Oculina patagonica]